MTGIHTIRAAIHGRYLVIRPGAAAPVGMIVGFHGQSETAEIQMAHLQEVVGARPWLLVSVQGLNRYYTRKGDVVSAWMTRQDRDLAIADNLAYVAAVVDEVKAAHPDAAGRVVYSGFSQGTAMVYRAAAFSTHRAAALIVLAGDLPPDVGPRAHDLPPTLLGYGLRDEWYTAEKAAADREALTAAGGRLVEHVFDDGHVRHPSFNERAGRFLDDLQGWEAARRTAL